MKNAIHINAILLIFIFVLGCNDNEFNEVNQRHNHAENAILPDEIKNGDLIFQTSLSAQSMAIQLATNSKYSHCGIIYKEGEDYLVFEAIQPVTTTPLHQWIKRGKGGQYVIKRLKNANEVLTDVALKKMKAIGKSFKGKNYDLTFEWSD